MDDLNLDDINYEEVMGSDFTADESPASDASPAAGAESVESSPSPTEQPTQPAEQQTPQTWNPDGPGNVKEALRQAREEARAYKEQLAQYQAWQQQIQQQQQEQAVDPLDPEAYSAIQQQMGAMQQQMQQAQTTMRLEMSETLVRQSHPDYDQAIQALAQMGDSVNINAFLQAPNPALAAYEYARNFTPWGIEQRVNQEVQRRVSELTQQMTPQKPKAPKTIGNLPAAASTTESGGSALNVPSGHIAQMTHENRDAWYEKALREAMGG